MNSDSKSDSSAGSGVEYEMDIETTIVDKLGVKLYDRVSAAVAELVANSYDADAEEVEVQLPLNKYLAVHTDDGVKQKDREIVVKDDGHGMTPSEADTLFLRVGRDRRDEGEETSREKNRDVMGRKGIGKLAPFGICNKIEIRSAGGEKEDGPYEVSHFMMDYNKITEKSKSGEDYEPTPLGDDGEYDDKRGTKVVLKEFNVKKVPDKETFKRDLSLRFATGKPDFEVVVRDNKEKEPESPFYLSDVTPPLQDGTKIDLDNKPVEHDDEDYPVEGWMGLSESSYKDELGGVRIYVRGKLAAITRDFGLPPGFTGEFVARSYLIGEIHAGWLDNEERDLIQTHRQDIIWSSELGSAFSEWGKERVKEVAKSGEEPRRERVKEQFVDKADLENKARDRYEKEGIQQAAVELGESLGKYAHEDELEFDEYIDSLTNFVLEIAPHKYLVDLFQEIRNKAEDGKIEVDELTELFESAHIAEITSFGQVARNKVNTIRVLERKINDYSSNEDDLHTIVENSPWLIDPTWQPLTSEKSISTVREAFEDWYEANYDEEITTTATNKDQKIPDFVMMEMKGAVRVVEIKKPDYTFTDSDFNRFINYVDAFEEFFENNNSYTDDFPEEAKFTIIADDRDLDSTNERAYDNLLDESLTGMESWHDLLKDAKDHHKDFLDAREQIPDIEEDAYTSISTTEN
jgi:hypothetical protein